jgi:hypothetical protein
LSVLEVTLSLPTTGLLLAFEDTRACQPRWARPPLTAASGNVRYAGRPTMFGQLKEIGVRFQLFGQLKYHIRAARHGDHFLSERPEK